jgi:tRNA(His) 5'-end guanylyltransferase
MRQFAYFKSLKIPEGMYPIVLVDGRNFHNVARQLKLKAPYDPRFRMSLVMAAKALMNPNDFQISLAYIQSDELSFIMPPSVNAFSRRVEKWISVFASTIAGCFCRSYHKELEGLNPISFDARIFIFPEAANVYEYLQVRQRDCLTNCLESYAYWTLRHSGRSKKETQARLEGMNQSDKQEMLFTEFNLNFNNITAEQKRGDIIHFIEKQVNGMNGITEEEVVAKRYQLTVSACPNILTNEVNPLVWNAIRYWEYRNG